MGKPRPDKVYKVKMNARLAAYLKGRSDFVKLRIEVPAKVNDLVWLVEWAGAPTGRADLCHVIAVSGNLLTLDRRICWHRGKLDDNLDDFSLTVLPDSFKMIDELAIPGQEERDGERRSEGPREGQSEGGG